MGHVIRRVQYFHTTVQDRPGEALEILSALADLGVNLLALTAIPMGLHQTQLTLFPHEAERLTAEGERAGLTLDGPHHAFLVQGEDVPGALVAIHQALHQAGVNVYAATGASGGGGTFGYVIHVRPADFEEAAKTLGV